MPAVWGRVAGGESVPAGSVATSVGHALANSDGRLVNRLWLSHPAVQRSLARARVLSFPIAPRWILSAAVRDKAVMVPPNALRVEDEQFPEPQPRPADDVFRLLYVGNCVATRALQLVFAALNHSGLSGVKLTVVGAGPSLANWRAQVRRLQTGVHRGLGQVGRDRFPERPPARRTRWCFPRCGTAAGLGAARSDGARRPGGAPLDWAGPGEMVDAASGVKIPVRNGEETVAALAAAIARLQALPELRLTLARAARDPRAHPFSLAGQGGAASRHLPASAGRPMIVARQNFLTALFADLEANGVRYCILGNYDDLYGNADTDLDLIVSPY